MNTENGIAFEKVERKIEKKKRKERRKEEMDRNDSSLWVSKPPNVKFFANNFCFFLFSFSLSSFFSSFFFYSSFSLSLRNHNRHKYKSHTYDRKGRLNREGGVTVLKVLLDGNEKNCGQREERERREKKEGSNLERTKEVTLKNQTKSNVP